MATCGRRTGLLFLVVPSGTFRHRAFSSLPLLIGDPSLHRNLPLLEYYMAEQQDMLLPALTLDDAYSLKKRYPDNCFIIVCLAKAQTPAQALGSQVIKCDYAVAALECEEQLGAIIRAEQSRRIVINAQAEYLPRHVYQQTATALLLNEAATQMLLIQRADTGQWFPLVATSKRENFPMKRFCGRFAKKPDMKQHFPASLRHWVRRTEPRHFCHSHMLLLSSICVPMSIMTISTVALRPGMCRSQRDRHDGSRMRK